MTSTFGIAAPFLARWPVYRSCFTAVWAASTALLSRAGQCGCASRWGGKFYGLPLTGKRVDVPEINVMRLVGSKEEQ
jgi:hypothetical protein